MTQQFMSWKRSQKKRRENASLAVQVTNYKISLKYSETGLMEDRRKFLARVRELNRMEQECKGL